MIVTMASPYPGPFLFWLELSLLTAEFFLGYVVP